MAWRELPDQASAVGFAAWTPHLGRAQSIEPPKPSGCWLRRAAVAGGMFDSFVDLHSAPGYEFAADSGMLSIDRFPSPVDKPCPTPAAWPFKAPGMSCQRLTYSASLSAGIFKPLRRLPGTGSLPAPHNIEFKTWQVPGVRLTIDCMSEASLASMYCGT